MSINYVSPLRKKILVFLLLFVSFSPIQINAFSFFSTTLAQTEKNEIGKGTEQIESSIDDVIKISKPFFTSLAIDLITVLLIITVIYYPNYKKMDTIFTFIMFNVVIFMLTFVLNKVKMSMGAAFGLFAVFSMLRYRTEGIGIKDMTYLFIFVALGLLSGIQMAVLELSVICGIIFVVTLLIDTKIVMKKEFTKHVRYEKINMVRPEKHDELIADLKERTGLEIHRIIISEIDYLRDIANITIYYYE